MKTIKTTIMVVAILFISTFAYASGKIQLNMESAEYEKAYVEIVNNSVADFEIDVRNELNEVIFNKKLSATTADYKRKYDFSNLEDGRYSLSVYSGNETNKTWFKIDRGVVSVENSRKTLEPFTIHDGNIWKMSYLNYQMEDLGLYVYDKKGLVFEKKIEPVFAVNKGLDLSKLFPGKYQIVFTSEHNVYSYEIDIN